MDGVEDDWNDGAAGRRVNTCDFPNGGFSEIEFEIHHWISFGS